MKRSTQFEKTMSLGVNVIRVINDIQPFSDDELSQVGIMRKYARRVDCTGRGAVCTHMRGRGETALGPMCSHLAVIMSKRKH